MRRRRDWEVNNPPELAKALQTLEQSSSEFNSSQESGRKKVSLADLIVLGGCAAVEQGGEERRCHDITVPLAPGRTDASQEQTDAEAFRTRSSRPC